MATDGVQRGLLVCLSVTSVIPAKVAEPFMMPFRMLTQVGPRNHVLAVIFRGMTSGFSCMLPSTVASGPDVRISPHAVDQHSNWLATEAVECHIKFTQ